LCKTSKRKVRIAWLRVFLAWFRQGLAALEIARDYILGNLSKFTQNLLRIIAMHTAQKQLRNTTDKNLVS
jgi:hypothetical protein